MGATVGIISAIAGVVGTATTLMKKDPASQAAFAPAAASPPPPAPAVTPAASAAKTPDQAGMRRDRNAAGAGVPPPTMLTGAAGVDPGALNLGKNNLLGL